MRARRHTVLAVALSLAAAVAAPQTASPAPKDESRAAAAVRLTPPRAPTAARKVSPRILAASRRLIVKFDDDVSARTEARLLRSADATLDDRVPPLELSLVTVPPRELAETEASLEASPAVEYVERDAIVQASAPIPNDTLWRTQWGLQLLDLPQVWAASASEETVRVAVIDTGVDAAHPDLAGLVLPGLDLVNGDADAGDDHGHGTAAAGVIAARAENALGGAGVCRTCVLLPVKALDQHGSGTVSLVAEGIVWAVDHGARVINMSLGAPTTTQALQDAIAYATAHGAILVAAAGNSGTSDPFYPAAEAGVISVGATMPDDSLYAWSNRGAWVRLAAPGCNTAPELGGGFVAFCGTSSAAPIVAGIAAVALAQGRTARPADVEAALGAGAIPVPDVARGRINPREALAALGAPIEPEPRPVPPAVRFLRSSLSPSTPRRTFRQRIGRGRLRVVVRAPTPSLAVGVVDSRARSVAHASGRRVLALARTLPAGTYRIVVRGRAGTRFTVSVTYPRTPEEASAWLLRTRT